MKTTLATLVRQSRFGTTALLSIALFACDKKSDAPKPSPDKTEVPAIADRGSVTPQPATTVKPGAAKARPAATEAKPDEVNAKPAPADAAGAPAPGAIAAAFRDAMAKLNKDNIDEMFDGMADDAVRTMVGDPLHPEVIGKAAIIADEKRLFAAYPDFAMRAARIFELSPQKLIVEVVTTGTNTGPMKQMPPTNKKFGVEALVDFTLNDDGKIAHEATYIDSAVIMSQLGVMPMPGEMPVKLATLPSETAIVHGAPNAKNEAAYRAWVKGVAKDTLAATANAHFAQDFVYVDAGSGMEIEGIEANVKFMDEMIFSMMPDWKITVEKLASVGNFVLATSSSVGTFTASPMPGLEPTNKPITFHTFDVAEYDDAGKMKRLRIYGNGLEFLAQAGLLGPTDDSDADAALKEANELLDDAAAKARAAGGDAEKALLDAAAEIEAATQEAQEQLDKANAEIKAATEEAQKELDKAAEELKKAIEELDE